MFFFIKLKALFFVFFLFSLVGCSEDRNNNSENSASAIPTQNVAETYIEAGDIEAIKAHGKLRILVPGQGDGWLPREGSPFYMERELAADFARSIGVDAVLVYVESYGQLITDLRAGKGDIIAANLTITDSRKKNISFTVPLDQSRELLVGRLMEEKINKLSELKNKTVAVQKNTSYEETLDNLRKKYPSIKKEVLADNLNADDILDLIVSKKINFTILDSNILALTQDYRKDFNVSIELASERALAWGVRKESPALLDKLNRYLNQQALIKKQQSIYLHDLDGIKKHRTLRVLTRNNAATYFLWRGELLGFEYDLVKYFAKKHQLRLEIIVVPSHEDLIPMLVQGKGDIIAAFMTVTKERQDQGIKFSRYHHIVDEIIVTRAQDTTLNKLADLNGRTIYVRQSSAYWKTLLNLKQQGINFDLKAAPETMETEEIIQKVAEGEYDLTLSDSHILNIELTWRDDIKAAFSIGKPRKNAWAVREGSSHLLAAINEFIKQEYKGLFYNITYNKYFKSTHKIKKHKQERIDLNKDGIISPYDAIVKKYAHQYGFDWRLIVAQMYQESRFDPQAESWMGAKGLMQVMPRTAQEINLTNLEDPETGIHAGIKYMQWVRNRFEPELDIKVRMWFTLAAYNAGQGHIKDARRLAQQKGWNPNRWFNNVERAVLLLSKQKYASKARYGYVRGQEPVNYVRKIRNRFNAYALTSSE
jgi:membrane-bound lytic murein transglycosylase F